MRMLILFSLMFFVCNATVFAQTGTGDGVADMSPVNQGTTYDIDAQIPPVLTTDPTTPFTFVFGGNRHVDITAGWIPSSSPPHPLYAGATFNAWSLSWTYDTHVMGYQSTASLFFPQFPWQVSDFVGMGNHIAGTASGWVRWKQYDYYYGSWFYVTDNFSLNHYNHTFSETFEVINITP